MVQFRAALTGLTAAILCVSGTSFTLLACRNYETPPKGLPPS